MSEKNTDSSALPDDEKDRPKRSIADSVAEAMQEMAEQDDEDLALILGVIKPDADEEDKPEPEE